jgi:paraquat-inducible protein A
MMVSRLAMFENPLPDNALARRTRGPAHFIAPLLAIGLIILPVTWWMPLFHTELLVFIENDVSVIGAAQSLVEIDWFLCAVVVLFGMIVPVGKLLGLLVAWTMLPGERGRRWISALNKIGKFSMLDVFLIAITIVGLKGVGLGKVEIAPGLYAFSGVVLMILGLSFWMERLASRA